MATPATDPTQSRTEQRIAELENKNVVALTGGGADKALKHKQGGRLTARERLDILLDPGSFVEMDRFITHRSQNFGMAVEPRGPERQTQIYRIARFFFCPGPLAAIKPTFCPGGAPCEVVVVLLALRLLLPYG